MDQSILYPMFALFVFTHLVMVTMLKLRVSGVKKGEIDARHFKTYDTDTKIPRLARQAERQYTNLMEIPLLFYIGCVVIFIKGNAAEIHLGLAWLFVALRLSHGFIHLTSNKIVLRLGLFAAGVVVNLLLWCFALFN